MKMRKLLAGAVAASLAVTSLATVAFADETKSFWVGGANARAFFNNAVLEATIGASGTQAANTDLVLSAKLTSKIDTTKDVVIDGATLKVTGFETEKSTATTEKTYTFIKVDDNNFKLQVIGADSATAVTGSTLNAADFYSITKAQLSVSGHATFASFTEKPCDWLTDGGYNVLDLNLTQGGSGDDMSAIIAEKFDATYNSGIDYTIEEVAITPDFFKTAIKNKDGKWEAINDAERVYDTINNGIFVNFNEIPTMEGFAQQTANFFNGYEAGEIIFQLAKPTGELGSNGNGGFDLDELWGWADSDMKADHTIIFTGAAGEIISNDLALAFNVDDLGSSVLTSVAKINTDDLTITFDISDILSAMGGKLKGNLHNVCYALSGELLEALKISHFEITGVTFNAFDTVEEDVEGDVDVEDDDADAEIEDDDATVEEDDDAAIEDDTTEEDDDADVEGDVIDTPVVEDDDANPGTGVALAVVPAMVAAAAVVLSKKRK